MIESVTVQELANKLLVEHPTWSHDGAVEHASRMLEITDDRLSDVVRTYVRDGVELDYISSDMSLLGLRALLKSTYLEAVPVMSVWLEDPVEAMAIVTRRRMTW